MIDPTYNASGFRLAREKLPIGKWLRIAAVSTVGFWLCSPAAAHTGAVPLTFWGDNFSAADARCQLEVGAGAARCGFGTWTIRRDCLLAQLDGGVCDDEADDAAVEALRLAVFQGNIKPACDQAELTNLMFVDLQDIQFDVVTFCRELEAAAVSIVFNPFFAAGSASALDDAEVGCIRTFAAVATKAFNYTFRLRKAALNHIAKRRRSARTKNRDVAQVDDGVSAARDVLQAALIRGCSEQDFQTLYGLTTTEAVELIASRSACLAARTYPVEAYDCPAPVCGNGMRETNERCDDGNTEPGDGCGASCQIEF